MDLLDGQVQGTERKQNRSAPMSEGKGMLPRGDGSFELRLEWG